MSSPFAPVYQRRINKDIKEYGDLNPTLVQSCVCFSRRGGWRYLFLLSKHLNAILNNYDSKFTKICGEGMRNAEIGRWKEAVVCQVNSLFKPCFPLTTFSPNSANREKPQTTNSSIPIGRRMSSIEFICNGIHVPLGLCLNIVTMETDL